MKLKYSVKYSGIAEADPHFAVVAIEYIGNFLRIINRNLLSRNVMANAEESFDYVVEEDLEDDEGTGGAILVTVLILILMTIGFERVKTLIEDRAHKTFEAVVEKMFGELAVLGFLSLCTFCISQSHFFQLIQTAKLDEEDIEHIVEMTHYVLFFIVIKSVHNCWVLIMQAESIIKRWKKFDRIIQIHGRETFLTPNESMRRSSSPRKSFARNALPELAEDSMFIKFCALEEEFRLDRDLESPFEPSPTHRRLDDNFNFASYLGKASRPVDLDCHYFSLRLSVSLVPCCKTI